MKKVYTISTIMLLAISLMGCENLKKHIMMNIPPDTIVIDDISYKTGFYGDMWVKDVTFTGKEFEIDSVTFRQVADEKYNMIWGDVGDKLGGKLYLQETQYEEAKKYFSNGDNYMYYFETSKKFANGETYIKTIENIDYEQFQKLLDFCKENCKEPFKHKEVDETVFEQNALGKDFSGFFLRKESNNGYFQTSGGELCAIEGKLFLVYYYSGKDDTIHVIELPKKLSDYFMHLLFR